MENNPTDRQGESTALELGAIYSGAQADSSHSIKDDGSKPKRRLSLWRSLSSSSKGEKSKNTLSVDEGGSTKKHPTSARHLLSKAIALGAFRGRKVKIGAVVEDADRKDESSSQGLLIQAARDGMLDVVESHLALKTTCPHDRDDDGFTALHHAARYNRAEVVKALVEGGANVNLGGGTDEQRPLHLACRYNSLQAIQTLLAMGAEINVRDAKGRTPLHYATRRGHDVVTKMLLSVTSCNVNASDHDLTTPLHMAAIQGNPKICELLISRGAYVGALDINNVTVLMWAAAEGHISVIDVLLKAANKQGASERKFVQAPDNEGNTALHLAVQNGKTEACEYLLDNSGDVDGQKHNKMTPLHLAAIAGNLDIAELLILRGASVNLADIDNMTPVHRAALYNKVEMIKLLVAHGADLNAKDKKNKSPLHCACWKGQTDAVLYLLDGGAQVAEVDTSLMTALHWAVQFGHYNTIMALLKHSGSALIEATDKNDQTVLHYAAHSGNVLVMKTLMDHGANPNAKDTEERTPLHVAAQCDNVQCVEALIHASQHETNDDDLDGRTPLLLAVANGHSQVVQVLLSLGADISNRDDEHRTALMLAAASGHVSVLRILLDNHVAVNDTDKLKNSALHYACSGGYVEAVALLLGKRADVTLKNAYDQAPLDLAIDNLHNEVAITMMKHRSWRDSINVRDAAGFNPMDRLVARIPEAAMVVLNHCVDRSCRDDEDVNLTMTFDYQHIDTGPDDPAFSRRRYLALNAMVEHERDTLLSHPLCQTLLYQKWVRFGRLTFYANLIIYVGYLCCLTSYTALVGTTLGGAVIDTRDFCALFLNESQLNNTEFVNEIRRNPPPDRDLSIKEEDAKVMAGWVTIFIIIFLLKETFKIFQRGIKYFFNVFNLIALILCATTYAFLHPIGYYPCLAQWRAGWIALFLAWINFIMYLRRIDFVGIYVIMFVTVLSSLLKVCVVWFFFCWAFAIAFFGTMSNSAVMVFLLFCAAFGESFYVLMNYYNPAVLLYFFFCWAFAGSFFALMFTMEYTPDKDQAVFGTLDTAVLNIFVMTLGEIEFVDNFVNTNLGPFKPDVYILLVIFLFLMPLVLMNLMIGIAVGDIEKIQRNAYLKRIALQVDLLYNFENTMPKWMQRKAYVRRVTIKPNEEQTYCWHRIKQLALGSKKNVQFIQNEHKDRVMGRIDNIEKELQNQQNRLRQVQENQGKQLALLNQIGARMKIYNTGVALDTTSVMMNAADQLSVYDNNLATQSAFPMPPLSPITSRANSFKKDFP